MQRLLWVDLETTCLDEHEGVILEVAAAITNENLGVEADFNIQVKPPDFFKASVFAMYLHGQNDLLKEIRKATYPIDTADLRLFNWLEKHDAEGLYLAGSNPSFDRRWMTVHLPRSATIPHYKHFDVNTLYAFFGIEKEKGEIHRAVPDRDRDIKWVRSLLEKYPEHRHDTEPDLTKWKI